MKSNKPIAAVIFLLTSICLLITALMTRQSGVSQAASGDGQALIGWASIAIHLGLPAFGIAAGAFMRAGNKAMGWCALVLVFLCASFSITNIMSFVAGERVSISKARDAEAKAKSAREVAALKAAEDRRNTINKMAQDQVAFLRTETKHADGRREKNDARDAGGKFIQEFSKTEITVAPAVDTGPVTVRPDAGAEMIAEITGWNISSIQLGNIVQIAILLIIFESVGWPMGSYLWTTQQRAKRDEPLEATPLTPVSERLKPKMLSGPKGGGSDKTLTIRAEPSAEWRALLDRVEFPPAGSRHKGALRPRLDPETQALRFTCWLAAYGESGDFHNLELDNVFEEFLTADHREETALRQVKPAMEAIKGKIASKRYVQGQGTTWNIQPPTIERMKTLLEKAKVIESEPFTVTQVAALPEVKTGESKSSSIIPFWRSRTAGGGLH